jgi:hypothetical protein
MRSLRFAMVGLAVAALGQQPAEVKPQPRRPEAAKRRETCAIDGRVLNALTGEPVKKASVVMFQTGQSRPASSGDARDGERNYVPTYYPGTIELGAATGLELQIGTQLRGVDVMLIKARTACLRGRLINPVTGKPSRMHISC